MYSLLKNVAVLTVFTLSISSFANVECSQHVEELREVKLDMEENLKEQSEFHDNLTDELNGTYGVLRSWEGQRLYIRIGGFDTLKVFADQVEEKTDNYDQRKSDNLKKIDDITFNLLRCLK